MNQKTWKALLVSLFAFALVAAACGSDDETDTAETTTTAAADDGTDTTEAMADDGTATTEAMADDDTATTEAMADETSLVGICPDPLIVQTDWFPEADHGFTYQLIGPDGTVDANNGVYSGPLGDTGITLEIRAGGPYVGFSPPNAQIYADNDIFMGYASTSEAIQNSAALPVVGIMAFYDVGPQMLMWDPEVYSFETFEDIRDAGAPVLYFEGGAYMDYFLGDGILNEDQIDASYDGSPTRFVTETGLVQQGFVTKEVYDYENEIEGWQKPLDFLLVHDSGFPNYQSALSVKPETLTESRECLEKVVPLFQQAAVDYITDPVPMNTALTEIVVELASFWTLYDDGNQAAVDLMLELGLVTDGDNGFIGDFDPERVQRMIDIMLPIYTERGDDNVDPNVVPEDIFTNEFLDESISLGQ